MEEKILIKSQLKNIKLFRNVTIIIGGLLAFLYESVTIFIFLNEYNLEWDNLKRSVNRVETFSKFLFKYHNTEIFFGVIIFTTFLILAMVVFFAFFKTELTVTNKRVFGKTTLGKRVDLPLDSISAISLSTLKGIAVATSSGKIVFKLINNNDEIHSEISNLIISRQDKSNPPMSESTVSIATDELKKYKELLDIGAITQEEFDIKKKELLGL